MTNEWSFGFNDPRLSGWVITIGYFIAFALCLWAGIASKKAAKKAAERASGEGQTTMRLRGGSSKGGRLWFLFSFILLLLGVNKQLDLQTLLTDIGRNVSTAQGWYENRRAAQAVFVVFFAFICGLVVISIVRRSRDKRGEYGTTPVGITLLIVVVVLRAGFLEHVGDTLLGGTMRIPKRVYSVLELLCVILAGLGAFIALVRGRIRKREEFRFDWEKE